MKKTIIITIIGMLTAGLVAFLVFHKTIKRDIIPAAQKEATKIIEKPFEKYSFDRLRAHSFQSSEIIIDKKLKDDPNFTSYLFYFYVDEMIGTPRKKVSGLINIPTKAGIYPIIVMNRGYVAPENFTTGEGTRKSGELLAQAGYVTIAADYLGFGESDPITNDQLENRFNTYPTALTLLASLNNINPALEKTGETTVKTNPEKVGMWGHSNGGHLSLSALAISGKAYPTVLWNPVSKPFPYSVFTFMDEEEDNGKNLRKLISDFEAEYDIELYSPPNYYKHITAPIQLHQGSLDEAVPIRWSNDFNKQMKDLDKKIEYFIYPDDHNFWQGSYNTVMQRTIAFYNEELK